MQPATLLFNLRLKVERANTIGGGQGMISYQVIESGMQSTNKLLAIQKEVQ